ncbi:MAG: bifunctional nicotinamidase/pyrazinamidase [Chlamydiia bacterium]|nr:bifunctional nicotinamidase/pyrazinamidase [Chlamydiia bacterium]
MKALLIVDIQNDFLPGGALAIPQGERIISTLNALQPLFPCVVATKDWHPPHHISFASTHGKVPGESLLVAGKKQELWPDHCVQGSWGADFSPLLHQDKIQRTFFKGSEPMVDSYSAFYDNAHIRSTGLGEYLHAHGVSELYIGGLAIEYCVRYSVRDALRLGFKTFVIQDACCGIDLIPGESVRAFEEMRAEGVTLLTSADLAG